MGPSAFVEGWGRNHSPVRASTADPPFAFVLPWRGPCPAYLIVGLQLHHQLASPVVVQAIDPLVLLHLELGFHPLAITEPHLQLALLHPQQQLVEPHLPQRELRLVVLEFVHPQQPLAILLRPFNFF